MMSNVGSMSIHFTAIADPSQQHGASAPLLGHVAED